MDVQTIEAPAPATTGAPPAPLKHHIVDKDEHGRLADRAVCGELWDRAGVNPGAPLCEACKDVLRARGHGHLIPFVGHGKGWPRG